MGMERLIDKVFSVNFSRRGFIKFLALFLASFSFASLKSKKLLAKSGERLSPRPKKNIQTMNDAVVVKGMDPGRITRVAVENLGGMSRFVKRGDVVVVKPNIGWDRSPEQAANTNPYVVSELVKMSFESGAKIVKVFDFTCNACERTYRNSGIYDAAKKAGATVFYVNDWKFYPGVFPKGSLMEDWPVFRDAVMCDCLINVPIAKHHSLTKLTLGAKNLMGVCGDNRGVMHQNVSKKLAETLAFFNPELTVIDAYRILLDNGPSGGHLADVENKNTVIASADPVLADSYAATLFNLKPEDIGYIVESGKAGLGNMYLKTAKIKQVNA